MSRHEWRHCGEKKERSEVLLNNHGRLPYGRISLPLRRPPIRDNAVL